MKIGLELHHRMEDAGMRRRGITEAVVGITRDLIGESSLAYKGSALWRYLRLAEETQLVELVVDVGRGVHG